MYGSPERLNLGPLAAERHGAGGRAPVVLVHGFAQNRFSFDCPQRSMARWLANQGWEVYNLELRGHGLSDGSAEGGFEDYVADLVEACAALDRPFVVGHSLGGAVAYGAASRVSMRGVVGIGAIWQFAQHQRFLRLVSRLTLKMPILLNRARVRSKAGGVVMSRLMGLSDTAAWWAPLSGWWPGSIEPDLLATRLHRGFDYTTVQVWLDMAGWAVSGDTVATWNANAPPLLCIVGDEDHLMPEGDARGAYDTHPGDRTLLVLDDFKHEVHWGHLDLVLGRHAERFVWPAVDAWMRVRGS